MILIADHDLKTAEMMVRCLRADGLAADVAPDALAVLKKVKDGGVDALVVDPALPGSGLEAVKRLRSDPRTAELPIILFGTSDGRGGEDMAKQVGAREFLVKGKITTVQFVAKLRKLVNPPASHHNGAHPPPRTNGAHPPPSITVIEGSYLVSVHSAVGDAIKMAAELGLGSDMRCQTCGSHLWLCLNIDPLRKGRYVFGEFVCQKCSKIRSNGGGNHQVDPSEWMHEIHPRVLVVDDEQAVGRALQRMLTNAGFSAVAVDDPQQALIMLKTEPFAVVISDQRMPGCTGVELLEQCAREVPATWRILLTGFVDAQIAAEAINRAQVFRLLWKPWSDNEILAVVREAAWNYELWLSEQAARSLSEPIVLTEAVVA